MTREVRDHMTSSTVNTESTAQPPRVKAPLVGVVGGLVLVGALGLWTMTRIKAATGAQAALAERRDADTKKAAALAKAPLAVQVVHAQGESWQPVVDFEGTLAASQAAS